MEHGWCLARVVDDIVVDVIVVDDVGNVASAGCLPLDALLGRIQVRVASCPAA